MEGEGVSEMVNKNSFVVALISGAAAGTAVDISLFPLDTIKTRMQAEKGFLKSGGFRGIYSGLFSAAIGSAPTAAMFFVAYETSKTKINSFVKDEKFHSIGHLIAASIGETSACLIRVPVEVVKQRTQAFAGSSIQSFKRTLASEGLSGFYRGFFSTLIREIPFSAIQFPLWEYLKLQTSKYSKKNVTPLEASMCGAVAGGFSAGVTTPLDVVKTRIMLAEKGSSIANGSISFVLRTVHKERGIKGLFSGVGPRMLWISIGGAIFLGVYEKCKLSLSF